MKIAIQREAEKMRIQAKIYSVILSELWIEALWTICVAVSQTKFHGASRKTRKKQTYSFLVKRLFKRFGSIDMLKILILVCWIRINLRVHGDVFWGKKAHEESFKTRLLTLIWSEFLSDTEVWLHFIIRSKLYFSLIVHRRSVQSSEGFTIFEQKVAQSQCQPS